MAERLSAHESMPAPQTTEQLVAEIARLARIIETERDEAKRCPGCGVFGHEWPCEICGYGHSAAIDAVTPPQTAGEVVRHLLDQLTANDKIIEQLRAAFPHAEAPPTTKVACPNCGCDYETAADLRKWKDWEPDVCEFCGEHEGDTPRFIVVCSACWNRNAADQAALRLLAAELRQAMTRSGDPIMECVLDSFASRLEALAASAEDDPIRRRRCARGQPVTTRRDWIYRVIRPR